MTTSAGLSRTGGATGNVNSYVACALEERFASMGLDSPEGETTLNT